MTGKTKILIGISSALIASGLGYFAYSKIRNKREINLIHAKLDGRDGAYGSIEDFNDVFSGASYLSTLKSKYENLIMLRGEFVTKFRKDLYDAIDGWGTDTGAIKSVFSKLKDRVQIAQIADSYQRNYNENLLEALKGDMDVDDDTMKELLDIIINKPAFRLNK